jgi:parallel beta-helix repeat protein
MYNDSFPIAGPKAILGQYNVTVTASTGDSPITSWTTFLLIDRIYINANGDVSPSSAPISRGGDAYRLTGNINGNLVDGIDIQRNNAILDGAGFTLNTTSQSGSKGIYLAFVSNVTIENMSIESFQNGVDQYLCPACHIVDTNLFSNGNGIYYQQASSSTIEGNNITRNSYAGILLDGSYDNNISANSLANTIASNFGAISLRGSSYNNNIVNNNFANNTLYGVYIEASYSNNIFHNNFFNNKIQGFVTPDSSGNLWDNSYPSGGNYWSDYTDADNFSGPYQNETGSDGIGDTPYAIYANNKDNYPLMGVWNPTDAPTVHLLLTLDPDQTTYVQSQSVTIRVNVLNQLNPRLSSTLTLTVTGPGDYYYFDFQTINVAANAMSEYSFTWSVPAVAGTYVVEVGLVPPRLTAYDAAWLEVA